MDLVNYYNKRQKELIKKAGVELEDKNYSNDELTDMENKILEYYKENCIVDDEITSEGQEFEDIIDILTDFEDEVDENKESIGKYIEEDDIVELKDGRTGILIDVTNDMYTIEIDDKFKTGNLEEDIPIVSVIDIKRVIYNDDLEDVDNFEDMEEE